MQWQVKLIDGRSRLVVRTVYVRADSKEQAERIGLRAGRNSGMKRRMRATAYRYNPLNDRAFVASGFVQPLGKDW